MEDFCGKREREREAVGLEGMGGRNEGEREIKSRYISGVFFLF